MVRTVLAQSKHDRHAKYLSYRVKLNAEQLFGCGVEVENISLFVWSEEVLKFEEVLLDMSADQVGLTRIKCFMV